MKKVPAVLSVRVSLNDGLTIVDLKPGNSMTLAELRQIVKKNGFATKEALVDARGTTGSEPSTFSVAGTNEQLMLQSPPLRRGDDWRLVVSAPAKP
jgi:hypothetical protein